jgi:hypothetical protein
VNSFIGVRASACKDRINGVEADYIYSFVHGVAERHATKLPSPYVFACIWAADF